MMSGPFSPEDIERVIAFHGHSCPGLAIGIRASEFALRQFGNTAVPDRLTVVEADMCGVDAIQFFTGCTFGKGNLIHRDYGKIAFSFIDRKSGGGVRVVLRPDVRQGIGEELQELMAKKGGQGLDPAEESRVQVLRQALIERFMTLAPEAMFAVHPIDGVPPRPAVSLESLVCQNCGESVMESRTRRFGGRTLCIPCFEAVEQKK